MLLPLPVPPASASNRPKMIRAGLLVTLTSLLMDTVWRDAATQPAASRWQGTLSTQVRTANARAPAAVARACAVCANALALTCGHA